MEQPLPQYCDDVTSRNSTGNDDDVVHKEVRTAILYLMHLYLEDGSGRLSTSSERVQEVHNIVYRRLLVIAWGRVFGLKPAAASMCAKCMFPKTCATTAKNHDDHCADVQKLVEDFTFVIFVRHTNMKNKRCVRGGCTKRAAAHNGQCANCRSARYCSRDCQQVAPTQAIVRTSPPAAGSTTVLPQESPRKRNLLLLLASAKQKY